MKFDKISGSVTRVIDGDTFDISVTSVDPNNTYKYNQDERIRINGIDAPEIYTKDGVRDHLRLSMKLFKKSVSITVHARDTFARVVGDVKII